MKMSFSSESILSSSIASTGGVTRVYPSIKSDYSSAADVARPIDPALLEQQREQVKDAVKQANQFFEPINRNLQFSIDNDSKELVVKVMDTITNQVIRQIPGPEMLAISRALGRMQGQGVMIDQKA